MAFLKYRTFDGVDDLLTTTQGSLASQAAGTITVATCLRLKSEASDGEFMHSPGYDPLDFYFTGFTKQARYFDGATDITDGPTMGTAHGFVIVVMAKNTSGPAEWSYYRFDTDTWTHTTSAITASSARSFPSSGGFTHGGDPVLAVDMVATAVFRGTKLSTTQRATLSTDFAAWTALSPSEMWRYDGTTPGNAVVGTATQSAITGTTLGGDSPLDEGGGGSTDATATPSTVTATGSVPAATVRTGSTVTAAAVTATSSVPAATVSTATNASVSATVVTATGTVPAATVAAGSRITAAVVTATAAAPSATVAAGSRVTASVVTATGAVPAATVSAGTGQTATASTVTASASVPAPTVRTGSTVTASTVTALASVPAPTVDTAGNATVAPSTVTATGTVPAPTVRTGSTATAVTVTATSVVPAPTVAAATNATATPAAVTAASTVPTPQVDTAGNATVTATVITATTTVATPAIGAGAGITPAAVTATAVILNVLVAVGQIAHDAYTGQSRERSTGTYRESYTGTYRER